MENTGQSNGTKIGLQARMTLYVTSAVLIVSAVILAVMASFFRKEYEHELNVSFSEAIAATTQFIEQKMANMESATRTVAELSSLQLRKKAQIDTILCRSLASMTDVQGVSIALRKGYIHGINGKYYERGAWFDAQHSLHMGTFLYDQGIDEDNAWRDCYDKGNSGWEGPITDTTVNFRFVGFYTPLNDEKGERVGMVYSYVALKNLTSLVTKYKAREDIDVSIYSRDGEMVVAPDDYILDLSPEDLMVQERTIDRLGWKVIFSADRNVVDSDINSALMILAGLILVLFCTIFVVIVLTVRFVAKPFVASQQRTEREKAVMDNEMQLAAGVQNSLLPHVFPPFPDREDIDLYACLAPARQIGGDLYDYFLQDGRLYFCIGDVSGKGVQASLLMAAIHYLFRSVAASTPVCEAVSRINRSLCTDNTQCMFATFWYGCLNLDTGSLEYVNAGHNSPVIVTHGKAVYMPMAENMPVGVLEDAEFTSCHTSLSPDDILFLYTDGVSEAMDVSRQEFGKEKTIGAISEACDGTSSAIVEHVLEQVRRHATGTTQSDDITMLCLKIKNIK